jgi:hypothetical protein
MWHNDDGLVGINPAKITNGPNLVALLASSVAFLGNTSHQLEFTKGNLNPPFRGPNITKLCVESILPLGGERVDLLLRERHNCGYRYHILGYNFVKRKGVIEQLKELKPPVHYVPARWVPDPTEMMKLPDKEFIMVFALHMATYKLPVRCEAPGCQHIIRVPMDLRKMYGMNLCPVCFPAMVTEHGKDDPYFKRAVKLLPHRCITKEFWMYPDLPEDTEASAMPISSPPHKR